MKINKNKLDVAMANACITIGDLAEKAEVSRVSIGRFINGRTAPRPITVGKIARALNMKVEELIDTGATS